MNRSEYVNEEVENSNRSPELLYAEIPGHIEKAAALLANGEPLLWNKMTYGLIVDGTNPEALERLWTLKGLDASTPKSARPFVSVVPPEDFDEYIDLSRYGQDVSTYLDQPSQLLTVEGHSLFYQLYAQDHLESPLVQLQNGYKTIVTLMHDNQHVRKLISIAKEKKNKIKGRNNSPFLLIGSSANTKGVPNPTQLYEVESSIADNVAAVIDVGDFRRGLVKQKGSIPIISLIHEFPTIVREGMYPPYPRNPYLANQLKNVRLETTG